MTELYDTPKKIKVELFYEITETGNIQLLKVDENAIVDNKILENVWYDLQEYFYSKTNEKSFDSFKRNLDGHDTLLRKIISCYAAVEQVRFNDERGYENLKSLDIHYTDIDEIYSAIRRLETRLELEKSKLASAEKAEPISFYRILASVERRLSRSIPIEDYSLERWCEVIGDLKEKEDAEQKYYESLKNNRNGRH